MKQLLFLLVFSTTLLAQDNPFIKHMYTADPSAHVWSDGRLYVYASHDIAPPRGCDLMDEYHVFSTDDMINWIDHGEILRASQVPWGQPLKNDAKFMWAPDCAYKDGKYYFYFPHPSQDPWGRNWKIGVAVSDKPASDFKVLDHPLLELPENGEIDPCVFMDDDGQAYFYYGGGGKCFGARLKDNMYEIDGELIPMEGLVDFHEATWVHKRNGVYYLSYSDNHDEKNDKEGVAGDNRMRYAMSKSPLGPWEYKGIYMDPTNSYTNHGSIVEFKGQWYAFYHNSELSRKNGEFNDWLRSICVDKLFYNEDGTIKKVVQTKTTHAQTQKKYDSYKGLVMAGYQGWFSCPGDGSDRGWYHYCGRNGEFRPGVCTIDMWPDVSEYPKTYKTEFTFADGSPAYVMSEYDESTVQTHFRWMREYGIDGVFVQRFVSEIKRPKSYNQLNKVWDSAIRAADVNNRAICVMYDLSGMVPGDEQLLLRDIDAITDKYDIKERKNNHSYLHHNGKPLVAVWGIGFNDRRRYGLNEAEIILDALIERGFSILIGVPTYWREFGNDTMKDTELHRLIKKCDIVMPWFVGRYNEDTFSPFKTLVQEDIAWCKENKLDYAPLAFPGFSWVNMNENSKPIPRNRGSFYWKQLSNYIAEGAEMIYLAMFDEIDEGTAIFKCATEVPVGESYFLALDADLGNDYYLFLAGTAGKMLKKEMPLTTTIPKR